MDFAVKVHDLQSLIDAQNTVIHPPNQSPLAPRSFFDRYQTIDVIHAHLDLLASTYPQYTTIFDVGKTYEGHVIKGIKIHDKNSSVESKEMLFHAGIHARYPILNTGNGLVRLW